MDLAPPNYHEVVSGSADWTTRPDLPPLSTTRSGTLLHPHYATDPFWNRASSAPVLTIDDDQEELYTRFIPSLPELRALLQLPSTLRFSEDTKDSGLDQYTFYVRDKMEFLIFYGTVKPTREITLNTLAGEAFLKISAVSDRFTVYNGQVHICSLQILIQGQASLSKITWSIDEQLHKISAQTSMDMLISKASGLPICKIHKPPSASAALEGRILFTEPNLTSVEKSVCISTAIVLMAEKRQTELKQKREAQEQRRVKLIFMWIFVAIGIGILFSFIVSCAKH